ncbi:hypothetical protein [Cryobacterium sp. Hb1]|uniref:hypothetical protein n=1 Tax=Cryobacterium sp. Hb1 TaxID=1259147 RepID=UPI00141BA793|nr:hypothetical protein [Cryobacterium sp. Hb1]
MLVGQIRKAFIREAAIPGGHSVGIRKMFALIKRGFPEKTANLAISGYLLQPI